jgi:hypothetical protein
MLTNPAPERETPTPTPTPTPTSTEQPAGCCEPAVDVPQTSAEPLPRETPGSGSLLPAVLAEPPISSLDAQIQKLKSEVPDIGVLGEIQKLSDAEYMELLTYEEVIATANTSWFEAGRALILIRDQELWRGNYPGFDAYCAIRWQFGRSKAYYLMGAASVCNTLRTAPGLPEPEFESQVRR